MYDEHNCDCGTCVESEVPHAETDDYCEECPDCRANSEAELDNEFSAKCAWGIA